MRIPVIEQAKIQAQVLVPLIKALQAELGEERANALVRRALGDIYRRYGEEFWRAKRDRNLGEIMASAFATFARGDALDYRVRAQSPDAFDIDVTGCRYAEFYAQLGEPELGFLLVCACGLLHGGGLRCRYQAHADTNHYARCKPLRFSLPAAAQDGGLVLRLPRPQERCNGWPVPASARAGHCGLCCQRPRSSAPVPQVEAVCICPPRLCALPRSGAAMICPRI